MVQNEQQGDFKTCFDSRMCVCPPPPALLGIYHRQWLLCATAAAPRPLRKEIRSRASGTPHVHQSLLTWQKACLWDVAAFINLNNTKQHCRWLCCCLLQRNNYSPNPLQIKKANGGQSSPKSRTLVGDADVFWPFFGLAVFDRRHLLKMTKENSFVWLIWRFGMTSPETALFITWINHPCWVSSEPRHH